MFFLSVGKTGRSKNQAVPFYSKQSELKSDFSDLNCNDYEK